MAGKLQHATRQHVTDNELSIVDDDTVSPSSITTPIYFSSASSSSGNSAVEVLEEKEHIDEDDAHGVTSGLSYPQPAVHHIHQAACVADGPLAPLCRRDIAMDVATSLWGLVTPKNFGRVMPGLYRCAYPKPENFSFMKTLGLKSILYVCRLLFRFQRSNAHLFSQHPRPRAVQ